MLKKVLVQPETLEYQRITALLPTIFPAEELPPPGIVDAVAPYFCFYEKENLIGFAQVLQKPDLHYLRYIAILPQYRSRGYGGQMLDLLLTGRGNAPLVLDVEPNDESAANREERRRRICFYQKHGMVDSGYSFLFGGRIFTILSTGESDAPLILKKYCDADHRYDPGFVQIVKRPCE